ncbi:cytochrome c oxidase subunit II [Deferribacteraceae bacterium V6Fe1]|nr:cytochrome c oxidase subunit II [Deferribacteraceae bacterium V6Fe1]
MYPLVSAVNKVDFAFILIYSIAVIVLLGITFAMVYFLFKYNKKRHPEPADIKGNLFAEILWTVIPTIIFMGMFFVGWDSFVALRTVPKNAIEITVEGKMWSWKFTYPNGKVDKELYVPLNTPVKLNITSADVIHSFYVPAYRIKIDAVPGLTTYAWFNPDKKGDYDILCAEYCGVRHAYMLSKVHVVDKEDYAKFISGKKEKTVNVTLPELLDKYGCSDCHSLNGEVLVGPPLNDINGRKTIVTNNGSEKEITADDKYIRDSILHPAKDIVKGFENIMPPYDGEIPESDLNTLINLMIDQKNDISNIEIGKKLVEDEGCTGCHSSDGSIIAAPSFKNLYNGKKQVIKDGKEYTVTVDDEYIYVSIKYPEREVVKDFDSIMPPFDYLTDEQIKAITEYIKSLK